MSKVIHMISGPRNISTAMMYAFDNRADCKAIDEPFYAAYLASNPEIEHPDKEEVIASQPTSAADVIVQIESLRHRSDLLFVKNMAHHLDGLDLSFLKEHQVFLLIRDPRKILASFSKVIECPTPRDIGLIQEWHILSYLNDNAIPCTVLDTDSFLHDPAGKLAMLCAKLDIPMDSAMLSWVAGPRHCDGVWARHWYDSVHKSTGFVVPSTQKTPTLNPQLEEVYQTILPYYQKMRSFAI
jgi:hypothetical protein